MTRLPSSDSSLPSNLFEVAKPRSYDNLPDIPAIAELKRHRQWVCWKYVGRDGKTVSAPKLIYETDEEREAARQNKPTKPPYSPRTGFRASINKPEDWGTYSEAVQRSNWARMEGVGFVLNSAGEYIGIDLDECFDIESGQESDLLHSILMEAETYAEWSPSAKGVRLICRGKLDRAYKSDKLGIEVYSTARYLTITGNHIAGMPVEIREAPKTLARLVALVEASKAQQTPATHDASPQHPQAVSAPSKSSSYGGDFFRNVNSAALGSLSTWVPAAFPEARLQPGTGAYRVPSRSLGRNLQEDLSIAPNGIVDFGVHDMGDSRDGKRTPIDLLIEYNMAGSAKEAAFWLCARVGRDPAALGWEESVAGIDTIDPSGLIASAGARQVVDVDGTLCDAATGEIVEASETELQNPDQDDLPNYLLEVPGLVGEIADFIMSSAKFPQRCFAVAAGLTLVGAAAGRHMAGPTMSGTHLFLLTIADTGYGKDHATKCVEEIMQQSALKPHIGPDEFTSMSAAIRFVLRSPLSVCPFNEFGAFLKRINHRKASSFEAGISKFMRQVWGSSFGPLRTPEWAERQMETIMSPAMSIFGESNPDEFFAALSGMDINNGLLNRFLLIKASRKPDEVRPALERRDVPKPIIEGLNFIYGRLGELAAMSLTRHDAAPDYIKIPWGAGAEDDYFRFSKMISAKQEEDSQVAPFLARTVEYAIRLATIRAISRNLGSPSVSRDDMSWGCDFAMHCAGVMVRGARDNMSENDHQANVKMVLGHIRKAGKLARNQLVRKIDGKLEHRVLEGIIKLLVESEQVESVEIQTGRPGKKPEMLVYRGG